MNTEGFHVPFPEAIKFCLAQPDPERCQRQLTDKLIDKSTREAFKAWADQHANFVKHSPIMATILTVINKHDPLPQQGLLANCISAVKNATTYLSKNQFFTKIDRHEYYDFTDKKNYEEIRKNLPFFEEYLETGLLHLNELVQALSIQGKNGETPLHPSRASILYPEGGSAVQTAVRSCYQKFHLSKDYYLSMEKQISSITLLLNKLPLDQQIQLLSICDNHGNPPVHYFEFYHHAKPYLDALPINQLAKIISIQNTQGKYVSSDDLIMVEILQLLQNRSNEEKVAFLCDPNVQSFVFDPSISKLPQIQHFIYQLMQSMSFDEISRCIDSFPRFGGGTRLIFAPVLQTLAPDELLQILSMPDEEGYTLLDDIEVPEAKRFMKKMNLDQVINLMSIAPLTVFAACSTLPENKNLTSEHQMKILTTHVMQGTRNHWKAAFAAAHAALENLSETEFTDFIATKSSTGRTILHSKEGLEAAMPFLQRMRSTDNLVRAVSVQDSTGKTMLHDQRQFLAIKPILERLSPDHSLALLSIKDDYGLTAATQHLRSARDAEPFLVKMNLKQSVQLLSLMPLSVFASVISSRLYKNMTDQDFEQIFVAHGEQATSQPWKEAVAAALPYLEKLSDDGLVHLLSTILPNGSPFLHTQEQYQAFRPLIERLSPALYQQLLAVQDANGLSIKDLVSSQLSTSWFNSSKVSGLSASITPQDYAKRVVQLHTKVQSLWSKLRFGEEKGDLNPALLVIHGKPRSPELIGRMLKEIIELMVKQEAWLGTPSADKPQELQRWYSTQLVNFESIVKKLEEWQNPTATSGYLTSIASVRFEGRCGSAYQSEIQQKCDLTEGTISLDSFVKRAAVNSLQWVVEKIVRERYQSDSHAMNQFFYAAGLMATPDPLAPVKIDAAKLEILKSWTLADFFREFGHGVDHEIGIEWLKLQTPEEFGPEYRLLEKKIKTEEETLRSEITSDLYRAFDKEQAEKLVTLLPTLPALSLPLEGLENANKEELIKRAACDLLKNLQSLVKAGTEIPGSEELVRGLLEASRQIDYKNTFRELITQLMATSRQNLEKKDMRKYLDSTTQIRSLGEVLLKRLEAIVQLDAKLASKQINPSLKILEIRQKYGKEVAEIAKQLEGSKLPISYDPVVHALPSQAVDNARRLAYNKDYASSYKNMLLHILSEIGTIRHLAI